MAEVILMPRLSDTMTEGVIASWHKNIGDVIKKGDLLAEIETDKATLELESYKDGTLLHIGIDKGGKLQVNDILAIIGKPGEDISSLIKAGGQKAEVGGLRPEVGSQKSEDGGQKSDLPAEASSITKASADKLAKAGVGSLKTGNSNQETKSQTSDLRPQTSSLDISKMEEVVLMPRLSDTMEEGVIASWNKNVGDVVKKGDVLAEIETDKATLELESYKNGTLLYVGAQKGEKIPVNGLLCIIGEKDKVDIDAIVAAVKGNTSHTGQTGQKNESISSTEPVTSNEQPATAAPVISSENGRVKASPLAKKIAKEKGVDLKLLHGSGDGGRIIKADIDSFKESGSPSEASSFARASADKLAKEGVGSSQPLTSKPVTVSIPSFTPGEEGYTDIPNSQIRNIIAKRLGESKFSAPHFYLTMEINMDNAISARTQLNEVSPVKISFNDLVVKAVALSLRNHPAVNSSWLNDKIRRWHHIHIGIAVAIEDGLIVPVVRFADQKTLPQIAAESKELSGKAKNKKLQPNEFTGNTFTVSNLGMMDIDEFTAIINPPDSCIMAVGKIKEVVVRKTEGFGVTNVMKVTLSCDHRSVDGATGAAFLQTFKKYLENPVMMLV